MTGNNGNVRSQTITLPSSTTIAAAYGYDHVNRLTLSAEGVTGTTGSNAQCSTNGSPVCEQYGYDQYGNHGVAATTQGGSSYEPPQSWFQASTNRVLGTGWGYDSNGNLTATAAGDSMGYDAESRMVSADGWTYYYDGAGQRVKKMSPLGAVTTFVYDANAELAAEYSTTPPTATTGTRYLVGDHLGSTRVATDASGVVEERHDFMPFGEDITVTGGSQRSGTAGYAPPFDVAMLFTGHYRDGLSSGSGTGAETAFDYFGARYYQSQFGRFLNPDPSGDSVADASNPQTWNLYTYVLNNPLIFTDPAGTDCVYLNDAGTAVEENGIDHNSTQPECNSKESGGYWVDGYVPGKNWVRTFSDNDVILATSFTNGFEGVSVASQNTTAGPYPTSQRDELLGQLAGIDPNQARINAVVNGVAGRTASFPTVCDVSIAARANVTNDFRLGPTFSLKNSRLGVSGSLRQAGGVPSANLNGGVSAAGVSAVEQISIPIPDTPLNATFGYNLLGRRNSYGLSMGRGKWTVGVAGTFGVMGDQSCSGH